MSDLDDLVPLATLSNHEEPHDPSTTPPSGREACVNCGARLRGRYCADCGQLDQPLRIPIHRFLAQSFSEFFGIDGRVWTTFGALLFKPGKLTAAFLAGHRRRYLRPLRVYLSATLVFFVLLALLDPVGRVRDVFDGDVESDSMVVVSAHLARVRADLADQPDRVVEAQREADFLRNRLDSLARTTVPGGAGIGDGSVDSMRSALTRAVPDSTYEETFEELVDDLEVADAELEDVRETVRERVAQGSLEVAILQALPPDSLVRLEDVHAARSQIYPQGNADINLPEWAIRSESVRRLNTARTDADAADAVTEFVRDSVGKIPTVLFLILPVFALLLKLLYARRGWYYSEHLVFGLHTHAFAFVVFSAVALLAAFGGGAGWSIIESKSGRSSNPGWLSRLVTLTIPLYFLVAQKRVYGQGWIKTIVKSLVLGTVYLFVLIGGLIGAFLLAAAVG